MTEKQNPLLCDIETGICEIPITKEKGPVDEIKLSTEKPVRVIYFTDPICSSCWGIEPQLRKLKLEYGNTLEIEYRMGGLLPDWNYNSGGISKPSDVAHHWDEVSVHYDMPIDGDVWLTDPLNSSYPPSIAFKAAQIQDNEKAITFLRILREMVFLQKKNITKWEHLISAAKQAGLNLEQFKTNFEGEAKEHFLEDLKIAKEFGVRGFPTLYFTDINGQTEFIYGTKPYAAFEKAVIKLAPQATKNEYPKSWDSLFDKYETMTAREFSELSGIGRSESEDLLEKLTEKGKLAKWNTKNGAIWKIIKHNNHD